MAELLINTIRNVFARAVHDAFADCAIPEFTVEHPGDSAHGDYSCNIAMLLAKQLHKKPREVAEQIVAHIPAAQFEKVEIAGPGFINIFLTTEVLGNEIESIISKRDAYGSNTATVHQKIMVEYAQPNTNKPQHVGHMRNAVLGRAVGNILAFVGHETVMANYMGDIGIHIMKSMLAYLKWGNGKTPADEHMKPDHFVGKYYVMFTTEVEKHPELMEEAQAMLRKWEQGDAVVLALWEKMNSWAYEGWKVTFSRLGITFDEWYTESMYTHEGKKIAQDALSRGIAKEAENGAIIVDLSPYNLGEKVLLRGDGTAVYMTKELALFKDNYAKHQMDLRLYVVGSDQEHYFKQFFQILDLLGHEYGKGGKHLSYGMVYTKEGKMSSRAGTVINADDMMDLAHNLAEKEIDKRHAEIDPAERDRVAEAIGIGALKYAMLRVDSRQDISFDPEEAVSFEGNTGPYLQYTYARIQSILRKAAMHPQKKKIDLSELTAPDEYALIRTLYRFPEVVADSARDFKPHVLCTYLFELAQTMNAYYTKVPILKADESLREARLRLIIAVSCVIKNGLQLLGIEALEKM